MTDRSILPHKIAVAALAVTAACLPLYVVRYHIGPLPTTLLEDLILVTAAVYVISLWTEHRLPAARTPVDIPIALFLVAGILGIVASPDHTRAVGIYRAYFLEAVACYYMAVDLIRTRGELRIVLIGAAAGSCVLAIGQITVFMVAFAHHAVVVNDAPAFLNTSPNADALYLEPPLAFATGFALFPSARWDRLLGLALTALILAAIVLTLSRASYLALAVLAVFLLISVPERRWRLRVIGALALVTLAVAELPFISVRIGSFAHSAALRTEIYSETLRMLAQRPILGAGISGYPIRVAPFRPSSQAIQLYPHDIWLTTWSEIGLLGLLSFAVIFFGLLVYGVRALARSSGLYRAVIWGATGALVLYLVHGLFDSPYWKNDLSVEFWLLAALMIVAVREARKSASQGPGSS